MVIREKCYIKACDVKECVHNIEASQHSQKNNYTSLIRNKMTFKRGGKVVKGFTPLKTRHEQIWKEVLQLHDVHTPSAPKADVMGPELGIRCKFHKVK